MKILFLAAEVAPFVKVGGLADVAGSLPLALAALGHDVRVVMPLYKSISFEKYQLQEAVSYFDVPIGNGTTGTLIYQSYLPSHGEGPKVPIYFVQNQHHFERDKTYGYDDDADRFAVFCRAALMMLPKMGWRPDLIHANDWHTALTPNLLKTIYQYDSFLGGIKSAFTIHNLAYQGIFQPGWLKQANLEPWGIGWGDRDGLVNIMGRGIVYADAVNTVSPTYVSEILTPEYGEKLDWLLKTRFGHIWGILNGIDYAIFNPATDPQIAAHFDIDSIEKKALNKADLQKRLGLPQSPKTPIIGMVSRLADQKGFDLVAAAAERILERDVQLVILGAGEYHHEETVKWLAYRYPHRVSAWLGFNADLAPKIYAGSDFFLMPSRFEPCGLGQLISMRYGTVPIVRHTGGLVDTVQEFDPASNYGNGFLFGPYDAIHMLGAIDRALAIYRQPPLWKKLMQLNMARDYSWEASARQYLDFYRAELGLS